MDGLGKALGLIAAITGMLPGPDDRAGWAAAAQEGLDRAAQLVSEPDGVVRPWRVTHLDAAVAQFRILRAWVPPTGGVDVVIDVVQSAQEGALFLNLGGPALDLGGQTSALVLDVGGRLGSRELSFSSGVTMFEIAGAVRLYAGHVGLTADASVSGVTIRSDGYGANQFASVGVLDDGGVQQVSPAVGIYRMRSDDANEPDPGTRVDLGSVQAAMGVLDFGQDVRGIVNGWSITGYGAWVWINRPGLRAWIELRGGELRPGMTVNAQNLGVFRAMRLVRWP